MGYIYSRDHQKAIDLYDVLGEGLTCHYESKEISSSKMRLIIGRPTDNELTRK